MAHRIADPLTAAARCALRAPSPLNTQPWRWQVSDGVLDLYADPTRQLQVADPRGRLLVLSCGSALHHARVALAAAGHRAEVTRLPYAGPLLARIRIAGPHDPTPHETALAAAIPRRRTDRRPFSAHPVPPATLDRLRAAVA
ncbi:MAG TPA: nitroreductase, partial [Micromonosporaceae bacterium]|nr:nitroreductase [Micromonosporaceae bacterium]